MPPPEGGLAFPHAGQSGPAMATDSAGLELLSCPRWDKCSAPICPLDRLWNRRAMQNADPVCFFLTEAAKPGAEALFVGRGWGHLYERMVALGPVLSARWGRIGRALQRAPLSGSRLARLPPSERRHDRSN
jgi:hypothetical protein